MLNVDKIVNVNTLAEFLALNQVKWECRGNSVKRYMDGNDFIIEVTHVKPEKSFKVVISATDVGLVKLVTDHITEEYDLEHIRDLFKFLLRNGFITNPVYKKYQESFQLVGIPVKCREEWFSSTIKTKPEAVKHFHKIVEETRGDKDALVRSFGYIADRVTGRVKIDVVRIIDEHDNDFSGLYWLLDNSNFNLIEINISPEDMLAKIQPMENPGFTPSNDEVKTQATDETDFTDIIGNEKPSQVSEGVVEDKAKYIYPTFTALSVGDIVDNILDEFNNLGFYTVASCLDFDPTAVRVAVTTAYRTWLNLVISVKDGILYLNHAPNTPHANYANSLKLDGLHCLATLGATGNNINLIRSLVNNFVRAAPVPMSSQYQPQGMAPGFMGRRTEMPSSDAIEAPWGKTSRDGS